MIINKRSRSDLFLHKITELSPQNFILLCRTMKIFIFENKETYKPLSAADLVSKVMSEFDSYNFIKQGNAIKVIDEILKIQKEDEKKKEELKEE